MRAARAGSSQTVRESSWRERAAAGDRVRRDNAEARAASGEIDDVTPCRRCPALSRSRDQMIAVHGAAAFSSPAASLASGYQDNGC